jgi:hypothetical protein
MSSASAGSHSDNTGQKNFAEVSGKPCPTCGAIGNMAATSTTSAEAQQGDGPAASSASSSAVGDGAVKTSAVSTCVGSDYAAAACEFGAVAVGPCSAAAASQVGVVAVGSTGAAASSNSANSNCVAVNDDSAEIAVAGPAQSPSRGPGKRKTPIRTTQS